MLELIIIYVRVGAAKLWLTWLSLTNCRQLDEILHTHTHVGLIFVNSMPVLSPTQTIIL